jgi:hypothetical protein
MSELYDIIAQTLEIEEGATNEEGVLAYFVENKLIGGRSNNDYALDQNCTKEEMLIFSKKVYDHIIYTLEMESKGAFWKVSDEDNTVYLLGSIHFADDSVYPLSKDLLQAFRSSDALMVEANSVIIDPEDVAYIQQKMMLEGDETIDMLIGEDTYSAYVEKIEALGVEPEVYNKLKPWYAAMVLQSASLANGSYYGTMGIDNYFQYLAYGHIPIVEVEGLKYQIDLFDSFSPELQEGYLLGSLSDEEESNDMMDAMMISWKSGDVETLEALMFTDEELTDMEKEFSEKLWDERNAHMTTYVQGLLENETEEDYFFVVGAGHMVNENGIVEGLKALGYDVILVNE